LNSASAILRTETPSANNVARARALVEDMSILVSPPDVYLKITDMISNDTASADEFSDIIPRDPGLTARILKLVNSSYFGIPSKVDTVSRGVSILGMSELSSLVYSVRAVQSFSRISRGVTNMNTVWRHGVYVGLCAKALAVRLDCLNTERLSVAGLLHDIGTLTIYAKFPDAAEATILNAEGGESNIIEAEHESLGFDHAYLGGLILENWNLPEAKCDAIRYHHNSRGAEVTALEANILSASDTLANYSGTGSFSETIAEHDKLSPSISELLDLTADIDPDALLEEVDQQFIETIYLLIA
jgi:putative nucleotidyltransferase with HDIG domain